MATLIKVKKEEPPKRKLKGGSKTSGQYGLYSGIINEKGENNNPTEEESIRNMLDYMKNNNPPESTNPSNVYRPKFSHLGVAYDRKKKQSNA